MQGQGARIGEQRTITAGSRGEVQGIRIEAQRARYKFIFERCQEMPGKDHEGNWKVLQTGSLVRGPSEPYRSNVVALKQYSPDCKLLIVIVLEVVVPIGVE
jgi:hypothetical protein